MQGVTASGGVGDLKVIITQGNSHPAEVYAALALQRILHVADTAPPPIRDQAYAFREQVESVLRYYFAEAMRAKEEAVIHGLLRRER